MNVLPSLVCSAAGLEREAVCKTIKCQWCDRWFCRHCARTKLTDAEKERNILGADLIYDPDQDGGRGARRWHAGGLK